MTPPSSNLVYYSVNTRLAFEINQTYYGEKHFVWCCPFFHGEKQPVSSNPKDIYTTFVREIESGDEHGAYIRQNVLGILKGADAKHAAGVITDEEYDEIRERVREPQLMDFKPLIFVIPTTDDVQKLIKYVNVKRRASTVSAEHVIEELPRTYFDPISLDIVIK